MTKKKPLQPEIDNSENLKSVVSETDEVKAWAYLLYEIYEEKQLKNVGKEV